MSSPIAPAQLWTGRVLTALAGLGLIASASMKLMASPEFMEQWAKFGFPASTARPIGVAELLCAILYLIPQTSALGVVLITGYLGGAIATHVHAGEGFAAPLILALVAWGGLYLREPRLRVLLPLRTQG